MGGAGPGAPTRPRFVARAWVGSVAPVPAARLGSTCTPSKAPRSAPWRDADSYAVTPYAVRSSRLHQARAFQGGSDEVDEDAGKPSLYLAVTCCLAATWLLAPGANAAGTLDQSQTSTPSVAGVFPEVQVFLTFTAGLTGALDQIDLHLGGKRTQPTAGLLVRIYALNGTTLGAAVPWRARPCRLSALPQPAADWVHVPLSPSAAVTAGSTYVIVVNRDQPPARLEWPCPLTPATTRTRAATRGSSTASLRAASLRARIHRERPFPGRRLCLQDVRDRRGRSRSPRRACAATPTLRFSPRRDTPATRRWSTPPPTSCAGSSRGSGRG